MKRKVRLYESDIRKLVKESVNRILKEHFFDDDDDNNPMFDMKFKGEYRMVFDLKRRGKLYYEWETVDEGEKSANSKEEAMRMFKSIIDWYSNKGVYAVKLRVEKKISTLNGSRWEVVYDKSGTYL